MPRPYAPSLEVPGGLTPLQRALEKRRLALQLLGIFGFMTTRQLKAYLAVQAGGLLPRLQAAGLVTPLDITGVQERVWHLTAAGEREASVLLQREVRRRRPDRFNLSTFVHELLIQSEFLRLLQGMASAHGEVIDLERVLRGTRSDRELESVDKVVRPDLLYLVRDDSGARRGLALEIEHNAKGNPELRFKLQRVLSFTRQFDSLTVVWRLCAGADVVTRYRRVWSEVVGAECAGDLQRLNQLQPVCQFGVAESYASLRYR